MLRKVVKTFLAGWGGKTRILNMTIPRSQGRGGLVKVTPCIMVEEDYGAGRHSDRASVLCRGPPRVRSREDGRHFATMSPFTRGVHAVLLT